MLISCFGIDNFFYLIVMFASMMQPNFPFLIFCSSQPASFESFKYDKVFFLQVWMRQLVFKFDCIFKLNSNHLFLRTVLFVTVLSHSHLMVHSKQMERFSKFFLNKWLQITTLYAMHLQIKEINHFLNFVCDFY